MQRPLTLLFILCLTCSCCLAQNDTLRVLFIGNSYTGVNNLPQLCKDFSAGHGKTLIYDSHTPGGNTIDDHVNNPTALNKIRQGNWDYVVLQEQSQIPTIDYYRYNYMYPAVERINDSIKKYGPCTKVLMYMTWGRQNGGKQCDISGMYCSPDFQDFSHMQDSLESAYTEVAAKIGGGVSPVGIAWKRVLEDTSIVLHSADQSHPNFSGSYLAACVFYSVLWNENPVGSNYSGSLSGPAAAYFQEIAKQTVFDSARDWNPKDTLFADFKYSQYGDSIRFTNLSKSPDPFSYTWDFGDGNGSTAEDPVHVYMGDGVYTVRLTLNHCSSSMDKQDTITVNTTGMKPDLTHLGVKVFPNPAGNRLTVSFNSPMRGEVQLIASDGSVLSVHKLNDAQYLNLDTGELSPGLYFVKVVPNGQTHSWEYKILKH